MIPFGVCCFYHSKINIHILVPLSEPLKSLELTIHHETAVTQLFQ